ncbi:MAG: ATP-binding cassette domain-containing protein, partial [Microbacterium sp.]
MSTRSSATATEPDAGHPQPVLRMTGIRKGFPGVRALDGASLVVRAGEVHGLVGENGAGKSTIIKVLAGLYPRDEGSVEIAGVEHAELTAADLHRAGIRFVHQELQLVPTLTVAENAFLGIERTGGLGLSGREMRRRAQELLRDVLGVDIAPGRLVRSLSPAERKLVQIVRALVEDGTRLIVFDEPTAPLGSDEAEHLLATIGRLREQGISSLYVSHYIGEVTRLCDRVTVFRGGRDVALLDDVGPDDGAEIIRLMVGRDIGQLYPERAGVQVSPLLSVQGIGDGRPAADVSFSVGRGEIVGITGVLGSGASEVVE